MAARIRADALVVELGLAADPPAARALIMSGVVIARDAAGRERRVEKAGEQLARACTLRLAKGARVPRPGAAQPRSLGEGPEAPDGETGPPPQAWASRAGGKLEAALDTFGVDVHGRICADFGIGTGGFTDVLLARGALRVHGVDVGYGDVAWRIRTDPRVRLHERTNVRTLAPLAFGEVVTLGVIDVSFISLVTVLPAVLGQLAEDGELVALVKPQFELPRAQVAGGVVTSDEARRRAVHSVIAAALELGLEPCGEAPSSVPGRDGNVEHLVHFRRARARS